MAIRRQVSLGHFRDSIHGEKLVTIFYLCRWSQRVKFCISVLQCLEI